MTTIPTILMYHAIIDERAPQPPEREAGAEIYDLSFHQFQLQMKWLKDNGYQSKWQQEAVPAAKAVILTFDDGEANNYTAAYPVLKSLGLKAYFFPIVKRIGRPGYLNWPQLKEMHDYGMLVGSHGLSHEILTDLSATQITEELRASKRTLEENLGFTVDCLSIPRGFCNAKVIALAKNLGYKTIFLSRQKGFIKDGCYPRAAVKADWSLKRFEQAVMGIIPLREQAAESIKNAAKFLLREKGYNWLRAQLVKVIK